MHGIILAELKKYVEAAHGPTAWPELLRRSGLEAKIHLPITSYPDEEFDNLIKVLCAYSNKDQRTLLEDFGRNIVPGLLGTYGSMLDPSWKTLDVLEHAGSIVHSVSKRTGMSSAMLLSCKRSTRTNLTLTYISSRKLCHFAQGIVRGFASKFGEAVEMNEMSCMLLGASACTFDISCDRAMKRSTSGMKAVKL